MSTKEMLVVIHKADFSGIIIYGGNLYGGNAICRF